MKYPARVMCISPIDRPTESAKDRPRPQVGDEDIATGEVSMYGAVYYTLLRFGKGDGYNTECFATLPEQSAEEMQEENHEAIIYAR